MSTKRKAGEEGELPNESKEKKAKWVYSPPVEVDSLEVIKKARESEGKRIERVASIINTIAHIQHGVGVDQCSREYFAYMIRLMERTRGCTYLFYRLAKSMNMSSMENKKDLEPMLIEVVTCMSKNTKSKYMALSSKIILDTNLITSIHFPLYHEIGNPSSLYGTDFSISVYHKRLESEYEKRFGGDTFRNDKDAFYGRKNIEELTNETEMEFKFPMFTPPVVYNIGLRSYIQSQLPFYFSSYNHRLTNQYTTLSRIIERNLVDAADIAKDFLEKILIDSHSSANTSGAVNIATTKGMTFYSQFARHRICPSLIAVYLLESNLENRKWATDSLTSNQLEIYTKMYNRRGDLIFNAIRDFSFKHNIFTHRIIAEIATYL